MKYTSIATILSLALLATGCVQEESELLGGVDGGVEWVPIRLEGGEITRLSVSDDTGLISCTEGDQVAVHTTAGEYKTCAVNVSKSSVPVSLGSGESRDGFAVYPASAIVNNSTSEVQVTYPDNYDLSAYSEDALASLTEAPCPMVAVNTPGKALVFRHVGGLLRITLENVPAGTKTVRVMVTGDPVKGIASVTAPGTANAHTTIIPNTSISPDYRGVTFALPGDNGLTADRTVVLNLPVPSGNYTDAIVIVEDALYAELTGFRTLKVSSIVAHRTGIKLARDLSQADPVNPHPFSIADDKQVYIAPGNLQLVGEDTWQFASRQWECFGDSQSDNHRDLFGWGTGDAPNKVSVSDDDYSSFTDWGTNPITNGGGHSWRTLSVDEWEYLLNRNNGSSWVRATVADVPGIILFPDDFVGHFEGPAIGDPRITVIIEEGEDSSYSSYVFSAVDWEYYETAGLVFLPAAGGRFGTEVARLYEAGSYWSSTARSSSDEHFLFFNGNGVNPDAYHDYRARHYGFSVRLVRDLGENTQPVVTYGLTISGKGVTGSGPYTLTMESQGGGIVRNIKLTSTMSVDGVASAAAWTAEYSSDGTSWSSTSPLSGFSVTASGNGSTNGETVTVSMPSGMTDATVYVRFSNAGTSVVMQVTRHINEPFEFTINAQGDKVSFSPGNLQYIGSASTPFWKFADFQWNYFGDTTGQNSSATNVDRDLFGWGTGGAPNKVSTSGSDYPIFTDWGTNAISNGGDYSWRTLTSSEWQYLFDRYEGTLWTKCTVKGVKGVMLFPDGFDLQVEVDNDVVWVFGSGFGGFPSDPYYGEWVIDDTQWECFESEGCVFLPAAGFREGTGISDVNDKGYYWSSTALSSLGAYGLYFSNNDTRPSKDGTRKQGYSVRLVRDLN